jgi:hypothetical protein
MSLNKVDKFATNWMKGCKSTSVWWQELWFTALYGFIAILAMVQFLLVPGRRILHLRGLGRVVTKALRSYGPKGDYLVMVLRAVVGLAKNCMQNLYF